MLRRSLPFVIVFLALLATCAAQFRPCKFSDTATVDHIEGIVVQRLTITELSGSFGATAFLPDSDSNRRGALFSHSAIHGNEANANLLKFALALARAGVAIILLDGAIEWLIPNDNSIRDPHLMACAGQWLTLAAHLDNDTSFSHLLVGTQGRWGGGDTPICQLGERPCFHPQNWIGLGQTGMAESGNTNQMLTVEGVQLHAEWARRHLNLKEIRPEWLVGIVEPRSN